MAAKSLENLGEFGFIREIRGWVKPTRKARIGIGDDTAVLPFKGKAQLCFTTDLIVEGVHFLRKHDPEHVGWKALAVNISDVAAMGGVPEFALMALTVPKWVRFQYLKGLCQGFLKCAQRFGVELVGGDTVKGKELTINVSLLGRVKTSELVLRSGAQPGDKIFVTGSLGGSIAGKHLTFFPRLEEAQYLVKRFRPGAMIDVSDGLIQDLDHILEESKVGAEIWPERIPVSRSALRLSRGSKLSALKRACADGEDFELLFTIPSSKASKLEKSWSRFFSTKLTRIGKILRSPRKLVFRNAEGIIKENFLVRKGYSHF